MKRFLNFVTFFIIVMLLIILYGIIAHKNDLIFSATAALMVCTITESLNL